MYMAYYNSVVVLRPDGLYRATIRYSYMYFFTSEESETFKTLKEANDWLLKKRCPNHVQIVNAEDQDDDNEELSNVEGNAFENDSESSETSEEEKKVIDIEDTRKKVLEEIKKKPLVVNYRQRRKKWNLKFKNN